MRLYLKYFVTFLKAASISLLFGGSWAITFYSFDRYADLHMRAYRNDFFFDIILFFFSGLVGTLLFYILISSFEKLYSLLLKK